MPPVSKKSIKAHVKKGDQVIVISGRDKGTIGLIEAIDLQTKKVLIVGVNQAKKSVKPNPMLQIEGGITLIDRPVSLSKVMLYSDKAGKPTRIKFKITVGADGRQSKVRVCRHTDTVLD
jgi:large subunit ribosomal protein L24